MTMENQTTVTEFILLGLSNDPRLQIFLFVVFLFIYLLTTIENMVIMLVIKVDSHLHTPMYFFLSHLAFVDICYSSTTVPKMLKNFLSRPKTISFHGCLAQMFFFTLLAATEVFILSAIAYDRYVAICNPLHYVDTMKRGVCRMLVAGSWGISFFYSLLNTLSVLKLHFCGPSEIGRFSCELAVLFSLSCTEAFSSQMLILSSSLLLALSSFLFTVSSYSHILSTIFRIHSSEGRQKAFSTCSSHLIVVGFCYGSGLCRYLQPNSFSSVVLDRLFSIQYSILTPRLNPLIYSLKNKEVKATLRKTMGKKPIVFEVM
ncbi:olfactory receptor 8S1-like [Emydura macquarii macquarii]|uniref:olfactory receptor 8S1-like n=1 Tax=Emydura macquarii macquarii TaxID=1129001 RepID=UPI00352B2E2D